MWITWVVVEIAKEYAWWQRVFPRDMHGGSAYLLSKIFAWWQSEFAKKFTWWQREFLLFFIIEGRLGYLLLLPWLL
jgi:hypothetical protein